MLILHKFLYWLAKHKIIKPPQTKIFAVETQVVRDNNIVVHKFVSEIPATSKRDAKWQAKQRLQVKVGAVANKAHIQKFNRK